MSLDAATITELSRTIAEGYDDPELEVVGVAVTHGGSDRVELLVSIPGAPDGPRIRMLNLTRSQKSDFERDFRSRLPQGLK